MELTLRVEEEGSGRMDEQTIDVTPGTEIKDVLEQANINPQTVIVERDGRIITHRDTITEDDSLLRVLTVISGG